MRIAIVGGGPGGLMTARMLETLGQEQCRITLFEASARLGGKVTTQRFDSAPVIYEAGVAELYDYSHVGPDPLKDLIAVLGLETRQIQGPAVILGDMILRDDRDIERLCGRTTLDALNDFYKKCFDLITPQAYYEGHNTDDNMCPWADRTFQDVLDEIPDETARRYVVVASRSDVATEPYLTSALDGLKNVLMDNPSFLRLYSIVGGNELLVKRIAEALTATIRLRSRVTRVWREADGRMSLRVRHAGRFEDHTFDCIVTALPNYWLEQIEWGGRDLRMGMERHLAHYAHPAHYLRISILFEKPFWRDQVPGDLFMSDAFGGCCIYDEGSRHPCEPYGVLGWLLSGNDAMALGNLEDETLIQMALDSLPASLAVGVELKIEGKVHRWIGTINGLPGGNPVKPMRVRHQPDISGHPGLFMVGDYLFDSTLNGVIDSAGYVTGILLTRLRKMMFGGQVGLYVEAGEQGAIAPEYFENYSGKVSYEDAFEKLFNGEYTVDLIEAVWGTHPPYRLLDCGSANGLTLEVFAKFGIDAWGIENSVHMHARTPSTLRERNLLGGVRKLPFPDSSFDFIYVTCLCYLPEEELDEAIREMFRVCRVGLVSMGVVSDMTREVIEDYQLLAGVKTLWSSWEWSEAMIHNGFRLAVVDPDVVQEVWRIEQDTDENDWNWYPNKETLRYCFYSKPDVPLRRLSQPDSAEGLPRTPIPIFSR